MTVEVVMYYAAAAIGAGAVGVLLDRVARAERRIAGGLYVGLMVLLLDRLHFLRNGRGSVDDWLSVGYALAALLLIVMDRRRGTRT